MISKDDLTAYGYNDMDDYFQFIVDFRTNGKRNQVKRLVKDMSQNQHSEFILWVYSQNFDIVKDYLRWS